MDRQAVLVMLSVIASLVPNLFLWIWLSGAAFLWWATRTDRKARRQGFILLIVFWALATRPVTRAILSPLESRYPVPEISSLERQDVKQVVVLTGGGYPKKGEMLSSMFPHASIYRFLGGLELCSRLGPGCRLIFSGSAGRNRRDLAVALTMKDLTHFIAPECEVAAEARSESTAEHPSNIRPLLNPGRFILVTSALHMVRSIRSFRKAGLDPIPYPIDFLSAGSGYHWSDGLPSIENLWKLDVAAREYLALAFYTIKGW